MEILIGREEGNSRLMVAVQNGGQYVVACIGAGNSVPGSVSRCKPQQGSAHCKITTDEMGKMTITNLNPNNVTLVDGFNVRSKKITSQSDVNLGKDNYRLDLAGVLQAAQQCSAPKPALSPTQGSAPQPAPMARITPKKVPASQVAPSKPAKPEPPACDIRHLEGIWKKYEVAMEQISQKQDKLNLMSRIPMFFTMGSGALTGILTATNADPKMRYVGIGLTVIGFVFFIYTFVGTKPKKKKIKESKDSMEDWLIDNYTCPATGKFLQKASYKLLRQQDVCPHCRGKRKS